MTSDWKVRLDALDPRGSFIVRAPAGSGKTELLTARFLGLLAKGGPEGRGCLPGQILAVTFTDKAALEMKGRIALWLARAKDAGFRPRNAWEGEVLERARSAWRAHGDDESLLLNPTAYRVQTFHGFCGSVCRAWPVESAVPVDSEVLADHEQSRAPAEAAAACVATLKRRAGGGGLQEAFERRLAACNTRTRRLEGQLASLLAERLRLTTLGDDPFASGHRALDGHFRLLMEPCRRFLHENPGGWRALEEAWRAKPPGKSEGFVFPTAIPSGGLESFPGWQQVATAVLTGSGTPWKAAGREWSEAKSFLATLPPDCLEALAFCRRLEVEADGLVPDPQALTDWSLLTRAALEYLKPLIPGKGLDFTELELGAYRALTNARAKGHPSQSLVFYHEHLRHLLVDEAQDMNRFQVNLLGLLTEGWRVFTGAEVEAAERRGPTLPHSHTVFIVGDPKQSIYRFRGSEVALFDEVAEFGIPRPWEEPLSLGGALPLTSNFRSAPGLVGFANRLFRSVFGTPPPRDPYDEVACGDGEPTVDRPPFELELRLATFKPPRKNSDEPPESQREARWMAREVSNLYRAIVQDPARASETIGILLPRRSQLDRYLAALRAEAVPVRMVEGEALQLKPEVVHLHNLFKALARPYDDVAWAGALRAPWCRLPEPLLYALSRAGGGKESWLERILSCEEGEVRRFREALSAARADFGREPFDATLLRAWESVGGPRAVAARYRTAGIGNVFAYLKLLAEYAGLPAEEAVRRVEERFEKAYTPPDPAAATSPVHLMTIHKAKGLEFDHVFAVYLGYNPLQKNSAERPPYLLLDLPVGDGPREVCAAPEKDSRWQGESLPYALLNRVHRRREMAETKRLFYVAVTRAKRSLTLSGQGSPILDVGTAAKPLDPPVLKGWKAPKGSPMDLLLSALYNGAARLEAFADLPHLHEPEVAPEERPFVSLSEPRSGGVGPLAPRPLPYVTKSPSEKLDPEEDQAKPGGADEKYAEDDGSAAIIGKVVHRLLERLARATEGGGLPPTEAVAAALRSEGLGEGEAKKRAPALLREAREAWDDPAFRALREGGDLRPEWGLEHFSPTEGAPSPIVLTGRLDLVIAKETEVIIVDYKTSRRDPVTPPEAFKAEVKESYLHQLRRYEEMLAPLPAFQGKRIRSCLLLTDLADGRLVWG